MGERRREFVSESEVSGNQTDIPATVRREFGVDDGDRLRWRITENDELVVEVGHSREATFAGFEGQEAGPRGGVIRDHDTFGLDPAAGEERTDE